MIKRTLVLNFPPQLSKEPITYKLVKNYDLSFNILKARIKPNEQGTLVIQINGSAANIEKSLKYLTDTGINWENIGKDIQWDDKKCVHCTACTSLCPTHALDLDRTSMMVSFDNEKCIVCGMCIDACAYKAIKLEV